MVKKIKLTKPKVLRASKKMCKNLETLYQVYEVSGKDLRKKGAPIYVYAPMFKAQDEIRKAIRQIKEVIGALS